MSHGWSVLISRWTSSLLWICVTASEGCALFLQVCRLGCCNLYSRGVRAGSSKQAATPRKWEQARRSGGAGSFKWSILDLFLLWAALGSGDVGAASVHMSREAHFPLYLCVGLCSEFYVVLSPAGCVEINCDVESCNFCISDCFWKSCIFWSTYSHRRLWIMSLFLKSNGTYYSELSVCPNWGRKPK